MRYLRALTISLVVHVIVSTILWILAPKEPLTPPHLTTVDLLESPELPRRPHKKDDEKTIVKKTDVPENMLSKEKHETKIASQFEQNVIKEMRARRIDETKNRGPEETQTQANPRALTQQKSAPHPQRHAKLDFKPESPLAEVAREAAHDQMLDPDSDVELGKTERQKRSVAQNRPTSQFKPMQMPGFSAAERGLSTLGEGVPENIALGDFTALNTDRALFYSFYSRIDDAIRQRWITYVKASLYELSRRSQINGQSTWTVELEILLDPTGKFVKAIVHESSGLRKIDSAPVQAFRDAYQFPNPPQEMVKQDGQIHLDYAFVVHGVPAFADAE